MVAPGGFQVTCVGERSIQRCVDSGSAVWRMANGCSKSRVAFAAGRVMDPLDPPVVEGALKLLVVNVT
eukprot:8621471-Lingulodinium_polyedra.AAC.1